LALTLAIGLALVSSVSNRVPGAAANPTGLSPSVYVVGGQVTDTGSINGTVDAFRLSDVRADSSSIPQIQHGSSSGGLPVVAVAVTPDAARAVLLEAGFTNGQLVGWTVQVLNVSTGTLSAAPPLVGSVAVGIAADPADSSVAYVADTSGQVWPVGLAAATPVIGGTAARVSGAGAQQGQTNTLALDPSGSTAYLGGHFQSANGVGNDFIDAVPLRAGGLQAEWTGPSNGSTDVTLAGIDTTLTGVTDLAVAPDGHHIYGTDVGTVFSVSLPLSTSGTTFSTRATSGRSPISLAAVTVSPDGQTVYAAGLSSRGFTGAVVSVAAPAGPLRSVVGLPSGANQLAAMSIAISPDQETLLATIGGGTLNTAATLFPVALAAGGSMSPASRPINLTTGVPESDPALGPTPGPEAVVVTPDQAPVASLTTPPAVQVGHPVTFNASSSTVAYGSVSSFAWNFGDGTSVTTAIPTVSHTYAAPGPHIVTVLETDSAGTSTTTGLAGVVGAVDGPGQTPYRRASPLAQTSTAVTVSTAPPTPTTASTAPASPPPSHPSTPATVQPSPTSPPGSTASVPPPPVAQVVPKLVLDPVVGPPGTIVTVTGSGFPPNSVVKVTWSLSTGSVDITADAHGNLPPTPLQVLTPDVLGPRAAVASSAPPATAQFLVVPADSEPGGDNAGMLFRSEGP
jgi:hypothetical protein